MTAPGKYTIFLAALNFVGAQAADVRIEVQADRQGHAVSRYLTGACIEDVNHEIYGGLYSQMVFGESFQEPALSDLKGFTAYGGAWRVKDDALQFTGAPGDKLVSDLETFADGEVGVEVFVSGRQCTNAGLIVRVARPGKGVDQFDGYEIALNGAAQNVRLGRHRQNWQLLKDTPCAVPLGQWVPLAVKLEGRTIDIFVNGKNVARYEDEGKALFSGTIGLRQFQTEARYRKLWVKTGGKTRTLPFEPASGGRLEVSGMWRPVRSGAATGTWTIEKERPFVGRQSQHISFASGAGKIGVENRGLNRWGMFFQKDKVYEGVVWARASAPAELVVALEAIEGEKTLAETRVSVKAGDWQRLTFTLTPRDVAKTGRLTLALGQPGSITLGYAALQPGDWGRFQGLPVRRDVAEALIAQGVTVLRYGGSMVNHAEYRWKRMIGPRDRRAPHAGTWYPHSSNGWGIVDFLDFCEAAGFLAIPAFNIDETPQDMADFIDYANGSATSTWGGRRAADGHPKPYKLRHLELGNEERVDETYFQKFKALAEAIWSRDPEITLVVGDFAYNELIRDPLQFRGAHSRITTLAAHQKILRLAKEHQREVWFDVHVGTDGPRPDASLAGAFSFIDALSRLADGARFKVAVFELNAGNHSQRRALANALALTAFERDGRVSVVASANCLQPDGQNDNGWNQGLLFLNPAQVWLQPPGYVTQMFARNYLPQFIPCRLTAADNKLDVAAKQSDDGKTLVLQAINPTGQPVAAQIRLQGFVPAKEMAQVFELAESLAAVNTAAEPGRIVPRERAWKHGITEGATRYIFPAYSVTILRLE